MIASSLIIALPLLWLWWPGIPRFLEFHGKKPLQIESIQGMYQSDQPIVYERFSYVYKDTKTNSYFQLGLVAIALIYSLVKAKKDGWALPLSCTVVLSAFIIGGNIFSPQYLLWYASFIPFIPLHISLNLIGITWFTSFYFKYYKAITLKLWPESLLIPLRNVWLIGTFIKMLQYKQL